MTRKNQLPVKVIVRDATLNKFLSSTGRLTRKAQEACSFPNLLNAIHTCLLRGLHDVELILKFEGDQTDRRLRVQVG